MKSESTVVVAGILAGLAVGIIFGGLFALFVNFILSLVIDFPVTWSNFFITWAFIIIFKILTKTVKS
jgi:hypothetical protein